MRRLNVKARNPDQTVAELSGGNQQKVAILRVLHQQADVLLLDEPTRRVDVGTKAEVYRLIGTLAAEGKAVIFVSSYLPELMATCDRLGVMSRGKLVALCVELRTGRQARSCRVLSRGVKSYEQQRTG